MLNLLWLRQLITMTSSQPAMAIRADRASDERPGRAPGAFVSPRGQRLWREDLEIAESVSVWESGGPHGDAGEESGTGCAALIDGLCLASRRILLFAARARSRRDVIPATDLGRSDSAFSRLRPRRAQLLQDTVDDVTAHPSPRACQLHFPSRAGPLMRATAAGDAGGRRGAVADAAVDGKLSAASAS